MATEYFDAPEVEEIARELIKDHRSDLVEAKIKYLFRKGTWKSGGEVVQGNTSKITGALKFIIQHDFLITINHDYFHGMVPQTQKALVDHYLAYAARGDDSKDGEATWVKVNPDIKDFAQILKRHGLWSEGLRKFDQAARQIEMNFAAEKTVEADKERVRKLREGEEDCPPAA
jgi:hypothetical protein